MERQKQKILLACAMILTAAAAIAQGNGTSGINEHAQMVTSFFNMPPS
nr:hypothetical protein [Chryseobacterium arthrosphaerae]